jgi:hypothetical protein
MKGSATTVVVMNCCLIRFYAYESIPGSTRFSWLH